MPFAKYSRSITMRRGTDNGMIRPRMYLREPCGSIDNPRDYALGAGHIGTVFVAEGFQHHPLLAQDPKGEQHPRPDKPA